MVKRSSSISYEGCPAKRLHSQRDINRETPKKKRNRRGKRKGGKTRDQQRVFSGFKNDYKLPRFRYFYSINSRMSMHSKYVLEQCSPDTEGANVLVQTIFFRNPQTRALLEEEKSKIALIFLKIIKWHKGIKLKFMLDHFCPKRGGDKETLHSTHDEVYSLLRGIFYKTFPTDLLGALNYKNFLKHLKLLITAGCNDTLRVNWFLYRIQLIGISWIVSHSDASRCNMLMRQLVRWLLEHCLEVLKTLFYITESGYGKKMLFYYRKDVWKSIYSCSLETLLVNGNLEMILQADMTNSEVGLGKMRILPKTSSFRPIINVGKASKISPLMQSRFHKLSLVLKSVFENTDYFIRPNVSNLSQVYEKWNNFVQNLKFQSHGHELYAVVVDIKDCFGCIKHDILIDLVINVLRKYAAESYSFENTSIIDIIGDRQVWKQCKKAIPNYGTTSFNRSLQESTLECYVKGIVIRVANSHYSLSKGIPQGGVLSSVLSDIYVNEFENRMLSDFGKTNEELLLRSTDDYLFVSTSQDRAVKFLDIMKTGCPDLNIFINNAKVQASFLNQSQNHKYARDKVVKWNGVKFNLNDFSVQLDYSKFMNVDPQYQIIIDTQLNGKVLARKIKNLSSSTNQAVLLDVCLNGQDVALSNVFEKTILTCLRMHAMISRQHNKNRVRNPQFLFNIIKKCAFKVSSRTSKCNPEHKKGLFRMVYWFALQAFQFILKKYSSVYKDVIALLTMHLKEEEEIMGWHSLKICKDLLYRLPQDETKKCLSM